MAGPNRRGKGRHLGDGCQTGKRPQRVGSYRGLEQRTPSVALELGSIIHPQTAIHAAAGTTAIAFAHSCRCQAVRIILLFCMIVVLRVVLVVSTKPEFLQTTVNQVDLDVLEESRSRIARVVSDTRARDFERLGSGAKFH